MDEGRNRVLAIVADILMERHQKTGDGLFDNKPSPRTESMVAAAVQSVLCPYLSLIALAGLAINAVWQVKWTDPIAALAVLPLIVWEGLEAMRGKACACC